jgi:hypothetical protein
MIKAIVYVRQIETNICILSVLQLYSLQIDRHFAEWIANELESPFHPIRCLRFETGLQTQFYDLGPRIVFTSLLESSDSF